MPWEKLKPPAGPWTTDSVVTVVFAGQAAGIPAMSDYWALDDWDKAYILAAYELKATMEAMSAAEARSGSGGGGGRGDVQFGEPE
jgi:hypothetical protein